MKKKIFSKRGAVLLAAVLVFLVSLFTLQAALTGGFRVQQRSVNWFTDEGVNLSGTLFVPENATQETPAAGIVGAATRRTRFTPATASSCRAAAMWCWPMTITAP